ncbi:acid phosphatase Pho11p [[Candida] jaroonii]|uniref:Acid phosphatase Pho11p n=1 Tax=[Candida] jaroonii TaxID=467808 RepID=A0ACA9Y1Y4_9ASCO|nr:acid phosphatase Pho11p [[Candida] jaroonii]
MVSIQKVIYGGLLNLPSNIWRTVANPDLAATEQYNLNKYLYGNGPYIQFSGFGIDPSIPDNCTLEQVQLYMRHGERFPGLSGGLGYEAVVNKLQAYNQSIEGPLSFLNDYEWFVPDQALYEYETTPANSKGPYNGQDTGIRAGSSFRSKYNELYDDSKPLPVFSAASQRVWQTSKFFAQGFLGENYTDDNVDINVISENSTQGFNTLTPRWGCLNFDPKDNVTYYSAYPNDFQKRIVERLTESNPGLNLTVSDIPTLFDICGYETSAMGFSQFCSLFTQDEFVEYSYVKDLMFYYYEGPGNVHSKDVGWVQLNASLALLKDDTNENKIWLSFSHDTDLELYHSAIGLFDTIKPMPNTHMVFQDAYHHIDSIPMAARLVTEKFKYEADGESYIRYIVNDAVTPIPGCSDGPGFSCKLSDFEDYVADRFDGFDLEDRCAPNATLPQDLTFYWDYEGNKDYKFVPPRIVA